MTWNYKSGPYEDPDCGCCDEAAFDEDLAYEEARDRREGWEDDSDD